MATVAVILKVFPSSVELEPAKLKEIIESRLPGDYRIRDYGEEPIAFGLKALRLIIEMPEDTEGGTGRLEEILQSIPEINEFEIEAVHRLG